MSNNGIDGTSSMKLVEKLMKIIDENNADYMEQFIAMCYLLKEVKLAMMSFKDIDKSQIDGFNENVCELIDTFLKMEKK